MAFIVKKIIHGNEYYYLNENKRVDGKVKTKTLAYLGKDRKEAEKKAKDILENNKKKIVDVVKHKMEEIKLEHQDLSIEELTNFCKSKGFIYPSSAIYGGYSGFWDFGHLGSELKNNLKKEWWKFHVYQREDVVGIDGSIITSPKVWEASGHIDSFSDIFVVCKKCKKPGKVDKNELGKVKCDNCGGDYEEKTAKEFKLMFETNVGESGKAYLRPETAQVIFTNFKQVYDNSRMKLPFGIAQIGKSFRNEIAPRDFLFRCREFEQMEIEYFIKPDQKCPYSISDVKVLVYSQEDQTKKEEAKKMSIKTAFKKGIIKKDWHAYWLAIEKCTPGELYLIGSDETDSIFTYRQIVEKLIEMSENKNISIKQEQSFVRPTSVPRLIGDTSKFRNATGWKPKIPITEILQDTLNYWRNFVNNDLY